MLLKYVYTCVTAALMPSRVVNAADESIDWRGSMSSSLLQLPNNRAVVRTKNMAKDFME
jgi:hypothetical protein